MFFFKHKSVVQEYAFVLLGTAFMAVAIKSIYDAMGLVTGGFTGISIIIKGMSETYTGKGIPLWFTNLLLNIPLFTIAIVLKGQQIHVKSLFELFRCMAYALLAFSFIDGNY